MGTRGAGNPVTKTYPGLTSGAAFCRRSAAGVGWVLRGAATGTSKSRAADRACVSKVEGSGRSAPRFSLTRFSLAELRSADSRGRCPHGFIFLVCAIPVLGQVFFGTAGLRCFWLDIVSFWKNLAQN